MEFDFSLITGSLPLLLQGALVTLEITALSVGLGLVFGLIAALAQISKFAPLRLLGKIYVDFIRGTPLLVQIFIIYFALPNIIGHRIDIILPQAFKRIIPPLGNEFIAMLKDSSLVSVIGFEELTRSGQLIIAETYGSLEIWSAVAVIYLVMTLTITRLVSFLEKRFKTSDAR